LEKSKPLFDQLIDIMSRLRSPDGCPWDREQTHESLRQYLLEEAYEVIETIDEGRWDHLPEELGDLLLQVVFHSQIAKEQGRFDINDVLTLIIQKLIRRHPHVFGDADIRTSQEQTVLWEHTKKQEGKKSAVDGVPKELSALLRAHRVQGKAATVGFDWEKTEQVWEKVHEELLELKHACQENNPKNIEEEFGDLLFALVNLSRFLGVNPEDSLRSTIDKFIKRFQAVESTIEATGKQLQNCTLEEMDAVWDKIKAEEKKS